MELVAVPLSAEAFTPFGEVLQAPSEPGQSWFDAGLGNLRPGAHPSLRMITRAPAGALPFEANLLERHEFSSQTFVPIDVGRWLIIVAPHAAEGGPEVKRAKAFIANARQGVTYRANTWHHGVTVLDKPASLAVFMWMDGTSGDEEFVPVAPFTIR